MSETPQHGRRRAEALRPMSRRELRGAARSSSKLPRPAQRMAVVAIAAALLAGGGLAQASSHNATNNLAGTKLSTGPSSATGASSTEAGGTPTAVSAPSNIALDFPRFKISPPAPAKPSTPDIAAQGAAITAEPSPSANAAPVDDPAGAQQYAAGKLAGHGWGAEQMSCLTPLWTRESSWLTSAENASSGAYGIAQSLPAEKMAIAGADYLSNYRTQIDWGLTYIAGRYGTPCGAWAHSNAVGWY